jgi:hypothetical protein
LEYLVATPGAAIRTQMVHFDEGTQLSDVWYTRLILKPKKAMDTDQILDLLLYHRRLQALVALELKIGEFEPEYIGRMQFYLSVLDDTVRLPEEQPSIGIILCKLKDRLIVEYALKDATLPIGVSSYSVTPDVPNRLQGQLPSAVQIASLLAGID